MKKYIGIGRFRVEHFCPNKDWLSQKLGLRLAQEPVYISESHDIKACKLVVCLRSWDDHDFYSFATFELTKTPIMSKAKNFCFLNSRGFSAWAKDDENLPAQFYGEEIYQAHEGEPYLWDLFKFWLGKSEDGINFSRELWYQGDFSQLNSRVRDRDVHHVGACAVIEDNIHRNFKNKIYNKKFIPVEEVEHFKGKSYSVEYIQELIKQDRKNKNKDLPSTEKVFFPEWKKLLVSLNDPFYPCPDLYHNGGLQEFDNSKLLPDDLLIKK
jgi:hypothetical protein